jgi:hypothetical protein
MKGSKMASSWEQNVERHMDKLGYYFEEKIPWHLKQLARLSDTRAMEQAVNIMDSLCERLVAALDKFEDAIKVKPEEETEGALKVNPEDEEDEEEIPGEEEEDEGEEGGEEEDEEEDKGEDLIEEIFGK